MNLSRMIRLSCLAVLSLPLLLVQGQQEAPKQKAEKILKGFKEDLNFKKPVKDILESLKTLEELADELHRGRPASDIALMLMHPDPAVRSQAANTIAAIGALPDTAYRYNRILTDRLKYEKDPEVRIAVLLALSRTGPHAKPVVPKLLEALKDPDVRIRRAAAAVFRKSIGCEEQLIPAAISALDDPDLGADQKYPGLSSVSFIAMTYLRFCGRDAKAAAPNLIKIFKSDKANENYRFSALYTLAVVAPEERLSLDTARAWLKRSESAERLRVALGVLAELGSHAKEAIPDLIPLAKKPLRDPLVEQSLKLSIVHVFQRMGPAAKEALPTLEMMAKTDDLTVRRAVLEALEAVRGK